MSDSRAARESEDLQALARQRIREANAAFQGGGGDPVTSAVPRDADEMRALVEAAWGDIGRSAPARGENYWDAGVTSLEIALFSEALSDRIGSEVEFNEVVDHPETGELADHLCLRGASWA
ncbi:MAG TPA: hypothetical protein VGS97_08515 [Actinocrinis sp.]|uniref:hypothetical protein n=1 Tax=Actinocrinis sp. TaxID=1920516 RepID=UPI002DDD8B79|nr:hypothetical protein [Actinocrinis sp.]HEV2344121.1 hypothetical protein [Actinocrinis sp.]